MIDPQVNSSLGRDALRIWLDFWDLTGGMRVDIIRRVYNGGDPAKMIPPQTVETTISSVRAVLIAGDIDSIEDRAGELPIGHVKLELIDAVHVADLLRIGGVEYQVDRALEKDLGSFSVWIIEAHRDI